MELFSALLALCADNSPVTRFDVLFDLRLNQPTKILYFNNSHQPIFWKAEQIWQICKGRHMNHNKR